MSSNPAEIGERIKVARRAANLSQTELAKRLDKTMRTIQKYESGEIEPSIAMINAIAKVLDVSPADLIGYRKPIIQLDSLSDVIAVLYQLNKKPVCASRSMCSALHRARIGLALSGSMEIIALRI